MHVAFAISFFLYVALSETLRHGVFGLSASETTGILTGLLFGCALLFLRSDVVFLLREPKDDLYGVAAANWSWKRTFFGLFLAPLLLVGPLIYGISMIQINFRTLDWGFFAQATALQALFVAIAHELFFRETVIKAFQGRIAPIALASSLAYFTFWMPMGAPMALIAVGTGLFFLSLRLIGVNILAVAVFHAAHAMFWSHVVSLGATAAPDLVYATYFLTSAAVIAGVIHYLFAEPEREFIHA